VTKKEEGEFRSERGRMGKLKKSNLESKGRKEDGEVEE